MPGYDVQTTSKNQFNEFKCAVCKLLLRKAIQLTDGKRICLSCYDESEHKSTDEFMEYAESINGGPLSIIPEKGYFHDRFARRIVSGIEVYCSFKSDGCDWVGPVKAFKEHVDKCDKRSTSCTKCDHHVPKNLMYKHLSEDCPGRTTKCEVNGEDMKATALEAHDRTRNPQFFTCDECNMKLQPEQMLDHKKLWCHNANGVCPFTDEGCDHGEVMNKKGMLQHIKENLIYHVLLLLGHLKIITRALSDVQAKLCAMKDGIYEEMRTLKQIVDDIQSKIIRWTDYLQEQLQSQATVVEDTKNMAIKCESSLRDVIADKEKCQAQLMDIQTKTFTHESQMQEHLAAFGDMQKQFNVLTDKIEALRAAVYEIRKYQQRILGQGAKPTLQIPVHPPLESSDYIVTYNGEMTWKISGVTQKRQEAILNKTRSFYSPPFFTSPSGYMCCGRIYMNGDGPAKGTHISLFFVVMKGPYDALQQWPFSKKITLMLLNQDGGSHHEESFMPDLSSSSFERPKKETNIASGSPFFYSLNALESYGFLKDDTIFVRIKVNA